VAAAVGGLEQADQVARLGAVEGDRVGAALAGLDLLLVPGEQELERVGQRRGSRGRVIRIGGVELPLAGDPLGRRAVPAAGGPDHPPAVLVEPPVPDPASLEDPLHDSTSLA